MKLFLFICALLSVHLSASRYERKLTVCAVFKDEARFLPEWIEYHRSVGVEQFWLYNNNSKDNYLEVLRPYMKKGVVKLVHWPSPFHFDERWYVSLSIQTSAYNHCLDKVRGKTEWLAMIGVDDYIVPVKYESVVKTLRKKYRRVSGLCINWVLFGTAGIKYLSPDKLLTESMTKRAPFNFGNPHVYRLIVRPTHVRRCISPHICLYKRHHWPVDTKKHEVAAEVTRKFHIDTLKIHHYWSRDERYLRGSKIPRYETWGVDESDVLNAASLLNFQHDMEMLRFTHKIKRKLGISGSEIGPTKIEVMDEETGMGSKEGADQAEDSYCDPCCGDCGCCDECTEEPLHGPEEELHVPVREGKSKDPRQTVPWWLLFFPEWFFTPDPDLEKWDGAVDLSPYQYESSSSVEASPAEDTLDGVDLNDLDVYGDLETYRLEGQ